MMTESADPARKRKGPMIAFGIIVLLAGALVALPLLAPRVETQVMDARARERTDGGYIALSDGVTHYEIAGPEDGAPVVFVHGFSTPYIIWDNNFSALANAGYRAVRYDLFGRGYSDRPTNLDYDDKLFDRQLLELIEHLKLKTPVTLVGVSMGGVISVIFSERHPDLVHALVLVDPAGFPLPLPLTAKLVRLPGVGEYLMRLVGDKSIRDGMAENFYDPSFLPGFAEKFEPQLQYEGYQYAILSTLRHMPMQSLESSFKAVGASGKPVLLIWGREDHTVPYETSEKAKAAIPQAELVTVEEAAHTPNYEKPEIVNAAMLDFLKRHAPAAEDAASAAPSEPGSGV